MSGDYIRAGWTRRMYQPDCLLLNVIRILSHLQHPQLWIWGIRNPCRIYFSAYCSWGCLISLWNCWFFWPSWHPVSKLYVVSTCYDFFFLYFCSKTVSTTIMQHTPAHWNGQEWIKRNTHSGVKFSGENFQE